MDAESGEILQAISYVSVYNIGNLLKVKIDTSNQNNLFGKIETKKDMRAA